MSTEAVNHRYCKYNSRVAQKRARKQFIDITLRVLNGNMLSTKSVYLFLFVV